MPVDRYGLRFPDNTTPATIELEAFHRQLTPEMGGLGRFQHLKNAIDHLWNEPRRQQAEARGQAKLYDPRKHDAVIWNDWSELMIEGFAEHPNIISPAGEDNWVTVTGPNASWKTTMAAVYALATYFASPSDTIIVLTSTSLPGLKKRIWKEITRFYRACPAWGILIASDVCIRWQKGSDDAGIFGVATGQDEDVDKAVEKIIGFHARNAIAIIDEMQATNEALVKACISLRAGADHFQGIGLGNADSELDPHGQMSEPIDGWDTVSVEDEQWQTKRGICIHLDGLESPRVREGDEFYPGLLRKSDLESAAREEGEDSPYFWQFRRGFWAPQGVTKTVLSIIDARRFHTMEEPLWVGDFIVGATLDVAYEGDDRCALRQHCAGWADVNGEEIPIIWHGELVILHLKASKTLDPIHYQIAQQTAQHCERWGVPSRMFAIDSTGEGEGPAGVLVKEHGWHDLMRVDFNGSATEKPISDSNRRPAREVWVRRVTELYFRYRARVRNGQIRGLDKATLLEFCQRRYEDKGNGMIALETKPEMKKRTGRSPDLADNAVLAEELFRERGVIQDPIGKEGVLPTAGERWNKLAKRYTVYNPAI